MGRVNESLKAKKLQTIRPEVELHITKRYGWFLIPFYALYVYAKAFRLFRCNLLVGTIKQDTIYVLSIPKVKLVDAC